MSERLITVLQFSSFKTASAISAGLLVSIAGFASAPESVLAESTCPQPAVALASDEVVPVTKANYSEAETQTVFAKYVTDVATATCTGGWNDFESPEGCRPQGSHGDSDHSIPCIPGWC